MKLVRVLVATTAALVVGVTVQLAGASPASAAQSASACVHCWTVIGGDDIRR